MRESPDNWERIFDDEFAAFGRRSIHFSRPASRYTLDIDESKQDFIVYRSGDVETSWWVVMKQMRDDVFRLSGSSPEGWYELTLTNPAKITFWPNDSVEQVDYEIPALA